MNKDLITKALMGGAASALRQVHKEPVRIVAPPKETPSKIGIEEPKQAPSEIKTEEPKVEIDKISPIALGYDHSVYYYLSRMTHQIHDIAASAHAGNTLISMAPLSYWAQKFPGGKSNNVDWIGASDFLMSCCHKVGVYNPDIVRGRGVAFDKGRVVLHLGNRLIVDGIPQENLMLPNSEFVYEHSRKLPIFLGAPLADEEAHKILEISNMFSWASTDMHLLFAGWLVTAPVCGGLPWRTHLWLTGTSGSGKSWIMSNFVKPLIGPIGFYVQSKTSEAGIRQHLRVDARPVIFDESESHNDMDRNRLQQVLDLARQASTDDGFQILKGTANGKEMRFKIHSSFLFSSINFGAIQAADENRIIPVTLVPMPSSPENAGKFDAIKRAVSETITPEFAGRLLARTLKLLPTIRANIKTFSRALSETMTSRQADTIGSVVAGVYSLFSSEKLTYDEAAMFLKDKDWVQMTAMRTETDSDHTRAISHLLEQVLRHTPSQEWSIAEALNLASKEPDHEANKLLARHGIRVKEGNLYIARSHHIIDEFYRTTPWAKVWDRIILQFPSAKAGDKTTDFAGYKKKPVIIPLENVLG